MSYFDPMNAGAAAGARVRPQVLAAAAQLEEARSHHASSMLEHLRAETLELQSTLSERQEVGLVLAHFGTHVVLRITAIECLDPHLMIFHRVVHDSGEVAGLEVGAEVKLMEHISQVCLMTVKLAVPEGREAYRIH